MCQHCARILQYIRLKAAFIYLKLLIEDAKRLVTARCVRPGFCGGSVTRCSSSKKGGWRVYFFGNDCPGDKALGN